MKKIISLILVILMLVTAIPFSINAAEADYENYYDDKPSWQDYKNYRYYGNYSTGYEITYVTVYLTQDFISTATAVDASVFPEIFDRIKAVYSVSREPNAFTIDFVPYRGSFDNYKWISSSQRQEEIDSFISMVNYLYSLDFVSTVIIPYTSEPGTFNFQFDLLEDFPDMQDENNYLGYDNKSGEKTEGYVIHEIRLIMEYSFMKTHHYVEASLFPEIENQIVRIKKGVYQNEFILCLKVFDYSDEYPYDECTVDEISAFYESICQLWKNYNENDKDYIKQLAPNWITVPELEAETPTDPTPTVIPGDVFGTGGRVNAADCNMLKQYLSGNVTESMINILNADVNGDGKINSKDSLALTKMVRGS